MNQFCWSPDLSVVVRQAAFQHKTKKKSKMCVCLCVCVYIYIKFYKIFLGFFSKFI